MSTPYRLIVTTRGVASPERVFDFATDVVRVGRDDGVEVRLPHPNVSQQHLRLERHGDQVYAVDLGSTNGTTIGGEPLQPEVARPLRDGEVLVVGGRFEVRFSAASPSGAVMTGRKLTADIAHQLVEDLLATGTAGRLADASVGPELVGEKGPVVGKTRKLPAPDSRTVIGRGETCDLIAIDPDLSREHIEVRRTWNGVTVADLGSKNGTRHNGERLVPNVPVILADGDVVRAGGCEFRFVDPAARYLRQLQELVADEPAPSEPPAADPDKSWGGQVAAADAQPEPAFTAAPNDDAEAAAPAKTSYLPMIIAAVVVIAAIAGMVLLFTS